MSAVAERLPIPAAAPGPVPAPGRAGFDVPDMADSSLPDPDLIDHWILLHGVPWAEYERLLAMRGECAVPRLTYLDGELELMSPSIHPDFVIEVVWTGGGIDKLEVWHGLGVPEVWVFGAGRLVFFERQHQGYREVPRSRFLPDLDPRLLEECMAAASQNAALRLLRERLDPAGAVDV